ncbi:damage-control phosphatase ARMT1 family protein [Streptomyces sporangiiformans]|uniref:Protein-glutamate O-methyltransferase family protein n=1 Tax=Streptomyces sporangiiformans TaxID=2315329 RepID=A0A505DQQ6_9ACTN|nr:damage-control phosphatase ARMT1 family protein [Streptomyces sporangiiformans]TPQ23621.1 protein-glutamate O-methyltransferase family protein [Streptomyces sporangiiformans]
MTRPSPATEDRAPVVVSTAGSFARSVLDERHPALIERVRRATPYPPEQQRALDTLLEEITKGEIERLDDDAPGAERWRHEPFYGQRWPDVPFLWAESFFYRKLLAALRYFTPGPWQGVDPFAPFKNAELASTKVDDELSALDRLPGLPVEEQDRTLLHSSLWGNRADLGFQLSTGTEGLGERVPGLVTDDSAALWEILADERSGTVCLVADNAGPELLPDLVLADHLLTTGRATSVVLHLKPYPYYVSDATTADVLACLDRLSTASGYARDIGERLRHAITSGRLIPRTHPFSCAPLPYAHMPADLRDDFASATLTVMKGDLNYRRLVGDRHWPATTPFSDVTAYFPGPVAALRTLKSDVVTGLTPDTVARLDAGAESWRTSGTHALIQVRA